MRSVIRRLLTGSFALFFIITKELSPATTFFTCKQLIKYDLCILQKKSAGNISS